MDEPTVQDLREPCGICLILISPFDPFAQKVAGHYYHDRCLAPIGKRIALSQVQRKVNGDGLETQKVPMRVVSGQFRSEIAHIQRRKMRRA